MKEKEIKLTAEELDYLLKGTLHWDDIAWRGESSLRKPFEQEFKQGKSEDFKGKLRAENPAIEHSSFDLLDKNSSDTLNHYYHGDNESAVQVSNEATPFPRKRVFEDKWPLDQDIFMDDEELDIEEEEETFWSGTKVYILLSLVVCITLGTWAYFVFV
jgi:hypothetical protein